MSAILSASFNVLCWNETKVLLFHRIKCTQPSLSLWGIKKKECQVSDSSVPLHSDKAWSCRHVSFPILDLRLPFAFGELDYLLFYFIYFLRGSNHVRLKSCGSPNLLESSETWALWALIISNEIICRISFVDNGGLVIFKWFFFILQQCPLEKAADSFFPCFI